MKKEELFKECQKIMLKTNGGVDDYVVALSQMCSLINDYANEKDQRIAELEEENENLKLCRCCECQSQNEYMLQSTIRDLEEENAKLQERLKNAIVPKFKVGQDVWFILKDNKGKDVFCGTVLLITLNGYYQPSKLIYTIIQFDSEWRCEEKSLFATEAEAIKHSENIKVVDKLIHSNNKI